MPLDFGGRKRSGAFDAVWPSAESKVNQQEQHGCPGSEAIWVHAIAGRSAKAKTIKALSARSPHADAEAPMSMSEDEEMERQDR